MTIEHDCIGISLKELEGSPADRKSISLEFEEKWNSVDNDSNSIEIDSELWNKLPPKAQEILQENGFKCIYVIY